VIKQEEPYEGRLSRTVLREPKGETPLGDSTSANTFMETNYYEKYVGGTPEQVFKYFSINDDLKDTLKNSYLWLSKPTDFNDPFDCNDNLVSFNVTEEAIHNLVKTRVTGTRQQRREEIRRHIKQPQSFKKALTSSLTEVIQERGICCFSRTNKNILLWSHYADKHKGICIGFSPRKSMETFPILHVKYEKDFKPIDYFSDKADALLNMMITKSKKWKYEKEMRILRDFNGRLPFKKECVSQIIFGCKTSDNDKKVIIGLLKDNGYKNVLFKQALMSKTSFSLYFEDIPE
jgi:hypothetical protein